MVPTTMETRNEGSSCMWKTENLGWEYVCHSHGGAAVQMLNAMKFTNVTLITTNSINEYAYFYMLKRFRRVRHPSAALGLGFVVI